MDKSMSSGSSSSSKGEGLPRIGRAFISDRPVPFWGTSVFIALLLIRRLPPVNDWGWVAALDTVINTWLVALAAIYFTEALRRARAWFRGRVHARARVSIEVGTDLDDRDDPGGAA